jgi:hypothetical protein
VTDPVLPSLVLVTGGRADSSSLAEPLSWRLGCALIGLDALADELAVDAEDTPRAWLRYDAEDELVRRLKAFGGEAVVDLGTSTPGEAERLRGLLEPWWDGAVEVRCQVPGDVQASLDAPRTVIVDTARPVELDDVANACRRETGARPARQRN